MPKIASSPKSLMKPIKIGIVGCGAIGSTLARLIHERFPDQAQLAYLCDRHVERAQILARELGKEILVADMEALIHCSDLIIEAASTVVAAQVTKLAYKYEKNVMIMSVGGLLGLDLPVARTTKFRIWIPSGAISGIDALLAAREAGVKSVKIVTRKPPAGLQEASYFKHKKFPKLQGKKEYCLFKGNASSAVKNFPQNINVAAVLSLAGIGPQRTRVEIWTSKGYTSNQHEITIEGKAGTIQTITNNVPSKENPKTSALAVYAALATLRKMFAAVRVGT